MSRILNDILCIAIIILFPMWLLRLLAIDKSMLEWKFGKGEVP